MDISDEEDGSVEVEEVGFVFYLGVKILMTDDILRTRDVISLRLSCPFCCR